MNAALIREALEKHWKAAEYLVLHECAEDAARMGRKIDTLVVSLWKSRGYEMDAIEIKISVSDWTKEVNNPEKADWWWEHTHRFSVAVPLKIAEKVRETLPTGWGLLAIDDAGKVITVVKPAKHEATPLPWPSIVGIMRGASGAGANALLREREKGRAVGITEGRQRAAGETGERANRERYDALASKVSAFEEASGINIANAAAVQGARRLGELVALVRNWENDPAWAAKQLANTAGALQRHVEGIAAIAANLLPTTREEAS